MELTEALIISLFLPVVTILKIMLWRLLTEDDVE